MPKRSNLTNALSTLSQLQAKLEDGTLSQEEAVTLVQSNKNQIIKALLHCNARPFIIHPSQLDTTQPEEHGYGTPEWRIEWEKLPQRYYKKELPHKLSAFCNLGPRCLAKNILVGDHSNRDYTGIIPEFSRRNTRRCCFVKSNGMRCMRYGTTPVCPYHINLVKAVPYMNDRFLAAIQHEGLREAYTKHLQDPNRRSVESEVALMRTMLNVIVSRVEVGQDLQELPMEQIGAITAMCSRITDTVQKMVDMETKMAMRLTVEQVTNLLLTVASKLIDITTPTQEQCLKIAEVIENLPVRRLATATIEGNADYGLAEQVGKKNTPGTALYKEDGTVDPNGFTPEQVILEKQWVNDKFKPAQAAYKAKIANLEQRADEITPQ